MKRIRILAALAILAAPAATLDTAASEDVAESLAYRAYIGGFPLGTLKLDIAMDTDRYATQARFDMTSLLRVFLDTDARASASGGLSGGSAIPKTFDYWVRDGKKTRESEIRFDAQGNPVEVLAEPPFREKPYDMDISQARGALDPATAIVMLSAPRSAACDVSMTVYDGRKLHKVSLREAAEKSSEPDRVKCSGKYERIAGFKDKHMQPDTRSYEFDAELEQVAPNRWRPKRVWAFTKFGAAVAVLQ